MLKRSLKLIAKIKSSSVNTNQTQSVLNLIHVLYHALYTLQFMLSS